MKRLLVAAAVLATLTHAAFAGELTLFSDSNFQGQRITIDRDVPNLRDFDFNDRASSVVVSAGTWLLCEHANFGGRCAEFGPGEYRELPGFNDIISSARQIDRGRGRWRDREGWRDNDRDGWRGDGWRGDGWRGGDRGGPDVLMFAGPGFEGAQVELSQDVRSLNDVGFNDRATSMIIREGRWEFCEHADFRGECIVLGPGRYEFLERMNNRISSMRRIR
ncbi:beta/gamma crystallin family protein [Massilia putida]|uniref:beta/gamma crystallin family protein n=1 Tax=Massilia putida TaxID=1141883 RepID=UPI000951FAAF|nr:beta/gamma crystallin family protein [Massilia putida]